MTGKGKAYHAWASPSPRLLISRNQSLLHMVITALSFYTTLPISTCKNSNMFAHNRAAGKDSELIALPLELAVFIKSGINYSVFLFISGEYI